MAHRDQMSQTTASLTLAATYRRSYLMASHSLCRGWTRELVEPLIPLAGKLGVHEPGGRSAAAAERSAVGATSTSAVASAGATVARDAGVEGEALAGQVEDELLPFDDLQLGRKGEDELLALDDLKDPTVLDDLPFLDRQGELPDPLDDLDRAEGDRDGLGRSDPCGRDQRGRGQEARRRQPPNRSGHWNLRIRSRGIRFRKACPGRATAQTGAAEGQRRTGVPYSRYAQAWQRDPDRRQDDQETWVGNGADGPPARDSRFIGPISGALIFGLSFVRVWPVTAIGLL